MSNWQASEQKTTGICRNRSALWGARITSTGQYNLSSLTNSDDTVRASDKAADAGCSGTPLPFSSITVIDSRSSRGPCWLAATSATASLPGCSRGKRRGGQVGSWEGSMLAIGPQGLDLEPVWSEAGHKGSTKGYKIEAVDGKDCGAALLDGRPAGKGSREGPGRLDDDRALDFWSARRARSTTLACRKSSSARGSASRAAARALTSSRSIALGVPGALIDAVSTLITCITPPNTVTRTSQATVAAATRSLMGCLGAEMAAPEERRPSAIASGSAPTETANGVVSSSGPRR